MKPAGWLKKAAVERTGLAGNLDAGVPDVRDSKWIGGDREGWERCYGWTGLASAGLAAGRCGHEKQRAKAYMDAIIAGQEEDGWICPCTREERRGYDLWAAS